MTIADQLFELSMIKTQLNDVLVSKGVDMTDAPFNTYPAKVDQLSLGGGSNFLPDSFLEGTWDSDTYSKILTHNLDLSGMQIDYLNILQAFPLIEGVFSVNAGNRNYLAIYIETTVVLDGNGDPLPTFTIDWGDGVIEEGYSGTTIFKNYSHSGLDPLGSYMGQDIEVRFKVTPLNDAEFLKIDFNYDPARDATSYIISGVTKLAINAPALTELTISPARNGGRYYFTKLKEVFIGANSVINMSCLFQDCYKLKWVVSLDVVACVDFSSMFRNCLELETIPIIYDNNGVYYSFMFENTPKLLTVPPMNLSNAQYLTQMFGKSGIMALPPIPTIGVNLPENTFQAADGMFNYCRNLRRPPDLDFTYIKDASYMFSECSGITHILNAINLPNAEKLDSFLSYCTLLRGGFTVFAPQAWSASHMLEGCKGLDEAYIDLPDVQDFDYAFYGCYALATVTFGDLKNDGRTSSSPFMDCYSLTRINQSVNGIAAIKFELAGPLTPTTISEMLAALPVWSSGMSQEINFRGVVGLNLSQADLDNISLKGYTYLPSTWV